MLNLVEEGFLALGQVPLDGQFVFGVTGVEALELADEIGSDATVRVRELG